jgi:hypothetical protein
MHVTTDDDEDMSREQRCVLVAAVWCRWVVQRGRAGREEERKWANEGSSGMNMNKNEEIWIPIVKVES